MLVAIHQPNFFPWLGYFDKLARADVFIVLDDVQFERSSAGTWSNRVKLLVAGREAWVTMPIRRADGVGAITGIRIDDQQGWRRKMVNTVRANYARAPHAKEVMPVFEDLVGYATDSLVEFNLHALATLCAAMHITPRRLVRSSTLGAGSAGTDRLIDLVKAVGGDEYLSGGGAGGYQQDAAFAARGVRLRYQAFQHPVYEQRVAPFVPGLSCLDAAFHCGFAGAGRLLGVAQ